MARSSSTCATSSRNIARDSALEEPAPKFFRSAAEFRKWLERNHDTEPFLWIGYWKKDASKKGIGYLEAVDEALCFGWIDGLAKGIDGERYKQRFSPRKPRSVWSTINMGKVKRLTAEGRMAKAGLAAFEGRDTKRTGVYSFENRDVTLSAAYEKRFRAQRKAWTFFSAQPPGYRRISAYWVMSAKREETRERRLAQLIDASAAFKRIPSLSGQPNK